MIKNLLELLRKVQCIWEPLSTTTKGGYQTLGNLFNSIGRFDEAT